MSFEEIKALASSILSRMTSFIANGIECIKKPFVKCDFNIVGSYHKDEDSESECTSESRGSIKIRLCDVLIFFTFLAAVISIFSNKNKD